METVRRLDYEEMTGGQLALWLLGVAVLATVFFLALHITFREWQARQTIEPAYRAALVMTLDDIGNIDIAEEDAGDYVAVFDAAIARMEQVEYLPEHEAFHLEYLAQLRRCRELADMLALAESDPLIGLAMVGEMYRVGVTCRDGWDRLDAKNLRVLD